MAIREAVSVTSILGRQSVYWKSMLSGAPLLLDLPTDRQRPPKQDFKGGLVKLEFDAAIMSGLRSLGKRHGTTLFMTVLAGWALLLSRLSGQEDVVIGAPVANRTRSTVDDLTGFIVNTVALRIDTSGLPTVSELLARVRKVALEAEENQDLPFEQVVELIQPIRSLSHTPLFQVAFALQTNEEGGVALPDPTGRAATTLQPSAKFDLTLRLSEVDGRLVGGLEYAAALFDPRTVDRYGGYLQRVLAEMAANPNQIAAAVPLLGAEERNRLVVDWNETAADYPKDHCIHQLFEAQVDRDPEAKALVYEGLTLNYGELNNRSNKLAHYLIGLGVRPDDRVAICVERSLEMVVGLLAILKAGGAYLPLDPAYPSERLTFMLKDSAAAIMLSHSQAQEAVAQVIVNLTHAVTIIDLVDDVGLWADQPGTDPIPQSFGLTPHHLAYVIYNSGSTGSPRGVMVEHGSLLATMAGVQDQLKLRSTDVMPNLASSAFDISLLELLLPLIAGARVLLVPTPHLVDLDTLIARTRTATIFYAVPSLMMSWCDHLGPLLPQFYPLLRTLLVGGDIVDKKLLTELSSRFNQVGVSRLYGPTEAAVITTCYRFKGASTLTSIGRPIANTRIYLLDGHGHPVPLGVVGEIYIGGAGVARGYLNRPELTAERFMKSPFVAGDRLYKTGDLARYLPDGNIEFLGRNDHQMKIHGLGIELGAIEACLVEHFSVREAVVIAREDQAGDKQLAAYCTAAEVGVQPDAAALRAHLAAALPDYMVPAAYVMLEALPLTPNGKLDRRSLPAPDGDAYPRQTYEPPQGEVEQALAAIWADLLGVDQISRHDNFFELGGHSLLAVRLINRPQIAFAKSTPLATLFAHPTLSGLAEAIRKETEQASPPIARVARGGTLSLSFAQQRLWFLAQLDRVSATYNIPLGLRLRGALDAKVWRRSLDALFARHEALRSVFAAQDGQPQVQLLPSEAGLPLIVHDLRGVADADARLAALSAQEAQAPFDLAQGPLIRARLICLDEQDHVFLLTQHHIVSDGWSMGVMIRELNALYTAFLDGRDDPLPPLDIQYPDYAAWQRQWLAGERLTAQADYWRKTLAEAPALLDLPTDRPRPPQQSFAGAWLPIELDAKLTLALKRLAHQHGATLFTTLLAAWAAVLARLSSQEDLIIGVPTANRGRREAEDLIGFFVNTLALRMDLSGDPTVAELLVRACNAALGAQDHQDLPLEQVVEIAQPPRRLDRAPLFQVLFAWQNNEQWVIDLPGLQVETAQVALDMVKFDLELTLGEQGDGIVGGFNYATSLFDAATIERHRGYLITMLRAMVADPQHQVAYIELLAPQERTLLLETWNDTKASLPRSSLRPSAVRRAGWAEP